MAPNPHFARIIFLMQVLYSTADTDRGSFMIYNKGQDKCVVAESPTKLTVDRCDVDAESQQFRWASKYRILSMSLKMCLGGLSMTDMEKVLPYPCDERKEFQLWECKEGSLLSLKDKNLHFSYGNKGTNVHLYHGTVSLSHWVKYGSQDDLCTGEYEEIYTIGGNAHGKPCHFPFKLGEKWYNECALVGRSDGHLWCATVWDYNEEKTWGFCPAQSSPGWEMDPTTGIQYQKNTDSAVTWHQARKTCQQQGGDLLSIVDHHGQAYISAMTSFLESSLWIGLNNLDFQSGWQWSDGNPLRYLFWSSDQPLPDSGHNCAVLASVGCKGSKWESAVCSDKQGFICHKGNSIALPPPMPGNDQPSFCPSHWVPYAGHCYYLERSKKVWSDALASCHKEGGDLASIHYKAELSFIVSRSGYLATDELWIGLNDRNNQMMFEWSDGSNVTLTEWQTDEPSHGTNHEEKCVLIRGKDAKWSDEICDSTYGYVCKKKASSVPVEGAQDNVNPGCQPGWTRFGSHCYNIGSEPQTFDMAKQKCKEAGSTLVNVLNSVENAFLVSLVGFRPEKHFWIGVSNRVDTTTFRWTNQIKVTFTHFNIDMPGRHQGCVTMTTGVAPGLWDVKNCENREKYICKKLAEGLTTTTAAPTTAAPTCPIGWNPAGQRNVCYKLYHKLSSNKKTWEEAREFCLAIGGDLMSIHGEEELNSKFITARDRFWIGLNAQDTRGSFVWSDGSPMNYENWRLGEPNNYDDNEFCGAVYNRYQESFSWTDFPCSEELDWLCQIPKGTIPRPPPSGPVYNTTEDGWMIYNGAQYLINTTPLFMEKARVYCQKQFGDLAVITEGKEMRFLKSILQGKKEISRSPKEYFIGLICDLDRSFSWIDGTPVTYTAWTQGEPNFSNLQETCVTVYAHTGRWNDVNCGMEHPSICKRSNTFTNTTVAPTTVPKGGCALGWIAFHGKCYKFDGIPSKQSWTSARGRCRKNGGDLVSIQSEKEQEFILTQLADSSEDWWIGLTDMNEEGTLLWTEGKGVTYTNWAPGHPNTKDSYRHDCVSMAGSIPKIAGQWRVSHCQNENAYICSKKTDPQIVPATNVSPQDFEILGKNSFKLLQSKKTWEDARSQCQEINANGDLTPVRNPMIQAYIAMKIYKYHEPVWIGLKNSEAGGQFQWVDQWPLSYTKWGKGEPKMNDACVYVDVDRTWKTASCNNTYYSICTKSTEIYVTEPPQLAGTCPLSSEAWIPFRGHCYNFVVSKKVDWYRATTECWKLGAVLVNIEDKLEQRFIEAHISDWHDATSAFWIGLHTTHDGRWLWIDNSALGYTNWKEAPTLSVSCVQIDSITAKWIPKLCNNGYGFICKAAKIITPTEKPSVLAPISEEPRGHTAIVLTIILVIVVLVGLATFLFRMRTHIPGLERISFENILYSTNLMHPSRGDVNNMET